MERNIMLQDLDFGRLENEYENILPSPDDLVVCIRGDGILLKRNADNTLEFPSWKQVNLWAKDNEWSSWSAIRSRYVFRMHGIRYFLWMGQAGEPRNPAFTYENARRLRQRISREMCYAGMTAWHLYCWYRSNRFCGSCGAKTVHDEKERMVRCPMCGNTIYPRISPAVIVAVTDADRILLTKYAGRGYTHYALVAGYTEIGETMEQTVQREVLEEVGLRVKHIRYYKSQPWGVDGNVLMGFYCDLDGSDVIHLDRRELAVAQWHNRKELPIADDGISLTREMIRVFGEGNEPKFNEGASV